MRTNVRSYTDKELLTRVSELDSFRGWPEGYWILGVQSNEDKFNVFDDKFYVYKGTKFIRTMSGTTNAGKTAMEGFARYNKLGVAVIKKNEWFWRRRLSFPSFGATADRFTHRRSGRRRSNGNLRCD